MFGANSKIWKLTLSVIAVTIILCVQFVLIEGVARLLVAYTRLGRTLEMNPYPSYTSPLLLPQIPPGFIGSSNLAIRKPDQPNGDDPEIYSSLPPGKLGVLVGGSAPYGHGVEFDQSFWGKLDGQRLLGLTFINAAIPANQIEGSVSQLAWALDHGDVKLSAIYTGDNEWEPFSYPRVARSLYLDLDKRMRVFRFYELLSVVVRHIQGKLAVRENPQLEHYNWYHFHPHCFHFRYQDFAYFSGEELAPYREALLARFTRHLEMGIEAAQRKNSLVLLYTTPIRYRLSPCNARPQFLSETLGASGRMHELEKLAAEGVSALERGDHAAAQEFLLAAYKLDPQSTLTNHYLGYAYEGLGDMESALKHFAVARDRQVGKSGFLPSYNNVIRSKADPAAGIWVIDLDRIFLDRSRAIGKGLNDEFIWDWCHPNAEGHLLIYEETRKLLLKLRKEKRL